MNKKDLPRFIAIALLCRAGKMTPAYRLFVVTLDDNCKTAGEFVEYPYYGYKG